MKMFYKPNYEVADIFRNFDQYLGRIPLQHHKVIQAIKNCRTKVLGEHALKCNSCGHKKHSYNSCRSRFCPKCQYLNQVKWVEKRCEELLPCQYFHVVFTVSNKLNPLILQNKKVLYNIMFKASTHALKNAKNKSKKRDIEIGCIGVLHTWGQNLLDHPHIHYIVPGGTLNKKQTKWVSGDEKYLLPVEILSDLFTATFLDLLKKAFDNNELKLEGDIEYLSHYANFQELLTTCGKKNWNVYCKKPFAGPEQVLNYLGKYTHRIAISNYRIKKVEGEMVHFKVRDRKDPKKQNIMKLHAKEFMRRFLLHILPKGFVRIRHFGLLGNRYKKDKIAIIRKLNGIIKSLKPEIKESWKDLLKRTTGIDPDVCPVCHKGFMIQIGEIPLLLNSA